MTWAEDFELKKEEHRKKAKIIEDLELKYPSFSHSNRVQRWVKLFHDMELDSFTKTHFLKYLEDAVIDFNNMCSLHIISKTIQKGDPVVHFKHGEGTFKFFSPDEMAIVQFNNESFSRVIKKEELLENR